MYNFGVYHWRRRLRRLSVCLLAAASGVIGWRRGRGRPLAKSLAAVLFVWGVYTGSRTLRRLVSPPPWRINHGKYEVLASVLPLGSAEVVVDVGCGTGRSLVGLAPAVGTAATFIALDVFDDRVILGNGPALARRNAAAAGRSVDPVRGDAATLPLTEGSVDVLTACRVLHDLSAQDARRTLDEARRALAPDGMLGVLELPVPHEQGAAPGPYWHDLLEEAGFTVVEARTLDGEYFIYAATPDGD